MEQGWYALSKRVIKAPNIAVTDQSGGIVPVAHSKDANCKSCLISEINIMQHFEEHHQVRKLAQHGCHGPQHLLFILRSSSQSFHVPSISGMAWLSHLLSADALDYLKHLNRCPVSHQQL